MSEANESKRMNIDPRVISIWAVIGIVVFALLWLLFSFRSLSNQLNIQEEQAAKDLREQQDSAAAALDADRKQNTIRLAEGMGSVFAPMIASDRDMTEAMKSVCETAASRGNVEVIIVTDTTGKVIATSNSRFASSTFVEMSSQAGTEAKDENSWVVTRPILYGTRPVGAIRVKVNF